MLEFIPWLPASRDARLRARCRRTSEPGQHRRSDDRAWTTLQVYKSHRLVSFGKNSLLRWDIYAFAHRCRPLCDHPLRGPLSEIHHQEGHVETRVQDQQRLLQEEAQEANHCGGKMASRCKSGVYPNVPSHYCPLETTCTTFRASLFFFFFFLHNLFKSQRQMWIFAAKCFGRKEQNSKWRTACLNIIWRDRFTQVALSLLQYFEYMFSLKLKLFNSWCL